MSNKIITLAEAKEMDYVGDPEIKVNPFTKEVTATVKCEDYDDKGILACFPHIFTIKG